MMPFGACSGAKPAVSRALVPDDGSPLAQPTLVWSGNWTTTVTPLVPEHAAAAAGWAGATTKVAPASTASEQRTRLNKVSRT
ncbi:MAG: hypothetical protein JWR35_3381 [Marmoricola sp.]|nr:hypothetical protein [Marmoricola sp.]